MAFFWGETWGNGLDFIRGKIRRYLTGAALCAFVLIVWTDLTCFAWAQTNDTQSTESSSSLEPNENRQGTLQLPEIVVEERSDSLLGVSDTSTEGTVGAKQLEERPILRPGEVLETMPGVIVSQHSGDGKANQYYLRGFNLDHGTDLATFVDGVPINLPTNAHGQGYTDLNFLIPELVQKVDYKKGPYFADIGDFGSAGAENIQYFKMLPSAIAQIERGSFGYVRGLLADSVKVGQGNLLFAVESMHNDGPWVNPEDYRKFNGVLTYSQGGTDLGYSLTAMGYHGVWNATDQIPERAAAEGLISRFGAVDPTDGGITQRYSLSAEWHCSDERSATKLLAYAYYYDMALFSNFTFFLDDPVNGDQFEQKDTRWVQGIKASRTWFGDWSGRQMENTLGFQLRNDVIDDGLFHTVGREILSTTRVDNVVETSAGPYFENKVQWFEKFRTVAGIRGDLFNFHNDSDNSANSGNRTDFIPSPKLSLVLGPWAKTEFYVNGGLGFHSNDARGVTTTVDPKTAEHLEPAAPLVRTEGAEVGVRTLMIPNLQSTLTLWLLDMDSELVFSGDAGTTEPSRPSRRYGIEWTNFYTPKPWLTIDADFCTSQARFRDTDPVGNHIPGAVETVASAGITVHDLHGFFSSLRLRYFGPRALIEDNSIKSAASTLLNFKLGYQFNKTWTLSGEIFNLLNAKVDDISYFYTSRLPGEPSEGIPDIHFHPAEPLSFRLMLSARF